MTKTNAAPQTKTGQGDSTDLDGSSSGATASAEAAAGQGEVSVKEEDVKSALRRVLDPEMEINIVDLGLVYEIEVYGDEVVVQMTLTSPSCPMGPQIISDTKAAAESVEGVSQAEITLVWEPFWTSERIDHRIRAYMGM